MHTEEGNTRLQMENPIDVPGDGGRTAKITMLSLSQFKSPTWLSLLVWTGMLGWLNTPRTISIEDFGSIDNLTGTLTIQIDGYHYGMPPVVTPTSEFETGWPRTYLKQKLAFPSFVLQNNCNFLKLFQNLVLAGIVLLSLIWLTQKIGVPKLRDYFILLTIAAILIAIGNSVDLDRNRSHLETTIQLACIVPVPITILLYVTSLLRKWQYHACNRDAVAKRLELEDQPPKTADRNRSV